MFLDLVKARSNSATPRRSRELEEELDDNRLRELMDELFSGESSEDEAKKGRAEFISMNEIDKGHGQHMSRADELRKEMTEAAESESDAEEITDESDERRELMDKVYSMVDDLSAEELSQIVESRAMKKALAMMLFERAPASELANFVTAREAQGEAPHEVIKGGGYMYKGEDEAQEDQAREVTGENLTDPMF